MDLKYLNSLRRRYGGDMTAAEVAFLRAVETLADACVQGAATFETFVASAANGLTAFYDHEFDDETGQISGPAATLSRLEVREIADLQAKPKRRGAKSNIDELERKFLQDVIGLIEFSVRNGIGFLLVLTILSHDVKEILSHGSLEAACKRGFLPKITGWSERSKMSIGEPEESTS